MATGSVSMRQQAAQKTINQIKAINNMNCSRVSFKTEKLQHVQFSKSIRPPNYLKVHINHSLLILKFCLGFSGRIISRIQLCYS